MNERQDHGGVLMDYHADGTATVRRAPAWMPLWIPALEEARAGRTPCVQADRHWVSIVGRNGTWRYRICPHPAPGLAPDFVRLELVERPPRAGGMG